jgi:hypothetical protein
MTPKLETEQDLIDAIAEAFEHAEADLSLEEIDDELRAAGLDPGEIGARLAAIAKEAYRQSPHNWRQRSASERADAHRLLNEKLVRRQLSRDETIRAIETIATRSPDLRAQAHFRNFEHSTDEDLSALLSELQMLEEIATRKK